MKDFAEPGAGQYQESDRRDGKRIEHRAPVVFFGSVFRCILGLVDLPREPACLTQVEGYPPSRASSSPVRNRSRPSSGIFLDGMRRIAPFRGMTRLDREAVEAADHGQNLVRLVRRLRSEECSRTMS